MRLVRLFLVSVILLSIFTGSSCGKGEAELSIFAAAGAKAAVDDVCRRYEACCGSHVCPTYGGGGEVLSQMILCHSGDVYISPEQGFMQKAVSQGAVDAATIKCIAYMIPVIAVQKGNPNNINTLEDLAKPGLQVAISRPETTLAGQYALEIFEAAGLTAAIEANTATHAANPNSLLTMLIMGEVDAVITWHYYAYLSSDDIENIDIPSEHITGIAEMQIAVSSYSQNPHMAQAYVDFASSDEGRAIFARHSYITDEEEVEKYRR